MTIAVPGAAQPGARFGPAVAPATFVHLGPLVIPAQPVMAEAMPDPLMGDPLFASGSAMSSYGILGAASPPPSYAASAAQDEGGQEFTMSYTFVEIGYFSTNVDTLGQNSDAWGGRAQLGLLGFLYVLLDYANESVDVPGGGSLDSDAVALGVGGHMDMSQNFNLVGELSWVYDDVNIDGARSSGWTALLGARWLVLPMKKGGLELNGGYRYIDRDSIMSTTGTSALELGGRFHFLNAFSVGLDYQYLEKDTRWGLNARWSF